MGQPERGGPRPARPRAADSGGLRIHLCDGQERKTQSWNESRWLVATWVMMRFHPGTRSGHRVSDTATSRPVALITPLAVTMVGPVRLLRPNGSGVLDTRPLLVRRHSIRVERALTDKGVVLPDAGWAALAATGCRAQANLRLPAADQRQVDELHRILLEE